MIGVYNKGDTAIDGTFIQNVIECAEPNIKVCGCLHELQEYNIAIAHVYEKEWNSLITNSSTRYVRVRVTTGGNFADKPPPTHKNGVYTFHLVTRAGDLEAEEWTEILSGLSNPEIIKQLVKGKNRSGLRRFFVHEVQEHLSALTILCEGYLAVHAENTDCSEDISSALELMGWSEFQKSDRYRLLIRQGLREKMNDVQQPQWWSDVFEPESFDNDVKKEWKGTTGEEEIPPTLNDLLEAIRSGKSVVPPKIVADAYCVLVKKK